MHQYQFPCRPFVLVWAPRLYAVCLLLLIMPVRNFNSTKDILLSGLKSTMSTANPHRLPVRPRGRPCKSSTGTVDSVGAPLPPFPFGAHRIHRSEGGRFAMLKEPIDRVNKAYLNHSRNEMHTWRMLWASSLRSCTRSMKPKRTHIFRYQTFQRQLICSKTRSHFNSNEPKHIL